jgi:hypothetical protein
LRWTPDGPQFALIPDELLTGSAPFRREHSLAVISAHLTAPPPSVTARRPDRPGPVDPVIASAMAKAPARRYPTWAHFADELGRATGPLADGELGETAANQLPEQTRTDLLPRSRAGRHCGGRREAGFPIDPEFRRRAVRLPTNPAF